MDEPSDEEMDEVVQAVAGHNPAWFDLNRELIKWLVSTVKRLMPLDDQAIEEWNQLVRAQEFDQMTRQVGEEFQHQRMIYELEQLALGADIEERPNPDGNEEGC